MAETAQDQIQKEALKSVGVEGGGIPNKTMADRLRRSMKDLGGRETMKSMTRGITDQERDGTVVKLTNPAEAAAAGTKLDSHNEFAQQGYDSLSDIEQTARRTDVVNALLRTPLLGDVMRGMRTDPVAVENFTQDILRDKHYQAIFNEGLQKITKMENNPSPDDVATRQTRLKALGQPDSEADARASLNADFEKTLQRDIDNLTATSVQALLRKNIETAEEVVVTNGKAMESEVAKNIMAEQKKKWEDPAAYKKDGAIRRNWDSFVANGVDGVITNPDQRKYLEDHPDVKKQLEAQIGEMLMLKKMRTGKLDKSDMTKLIDSEWLGADQGARVDKIRSIFEAHQGFKDILAEMQEKGYVDKNIWDKIKNAGPGVAAGGMLAALLMLLGLPSLALAGGALKIGLGAAGGGAALYGANKMREAA